MRRPFITPRRVGKHRRPQHHVLLWACIVVGSLLLLGSTAAFATIILPASRPNTGSSFVTTPPTDGPSEGALPSPPNP